MSCVRNHILTDLYVTMDFQVTKMRQDNQSQHLSERMQLETRVAFSYHTSQLKKSRKQNHQISYSFAYPTLPMEQSYYKPFSYAFHVVMSPIEEALRSKVAETSCAAHIFFREICQIAKFQFFDCVRHTKQTLWKLFNIHLKFLQTRYYASVGGQKEITSNFILPTTAFAYNAHTFTSRSPNKSALEYVHESMV